MNPKLDRLARRIPILKEIALLREQNRFLLAEVRKLNETLRSLLSQNPALQWGDERQTTDSFDFQWTHLPEGRWLTSDPEFMRQVAAQVVEFTALPADWFRGRRVLDVGCGTGRYTQALLSLGAHVTAVDQSASACRRTAETCAAFSERLTVKDLDLLQWTEPADFDLVFCFGVVHHTGRTYRAIRNVAAKVRPDGHLFLMVYGFPTELGHFSELNVYEDLREELRARSAAEKKAVLAQRYGAELANAYFDAVSPKINDLLSLEELREFLQGLGFTGIRCTVRNRNHHVVARKTAPV
ncbi:MAG: class I SAM-dependent methyltransferase [Opitutaceae bacterium]|nr:class I SAM-dependent methyltransferase [Opitutaceae bacterium]